MGWSASTVWPALANALVTFVNRSFTVGPVEDWSVAGTEAGFSAMRCLFGYGRQIFFLEDFIEQAHLVNSRQVRRGPEKTDLVRSLGRLAQRRAHRVPGEFHSFHRPR